MNEKYSASGLMNPFFPDEVTFGEKGVTFKVRKLFATIRIIPRMRPEIIINNFTKGDAKKVKELILQKVQA
jgi:hypothetical protein